MLEVLCRGHESQRALFPHLPRSVKEREYGVGFEENTRDLESKKDCDVVCFFCQSDAGYPKELKWRVCNSIFPERAQDVELCCCTGFNAPKNISNAEEIARFYGSTEATLQSRTQSFGRNLSGNFNVAKSFIKFGRKWSFEKLSNNPNCRQLWRNIYQEMWDQLSCKWRGRIESLHPRLDFGSSPSVIARLSSQMIGIAKCLFIEVSKPRCFLLFPKDSLSGPVNRSTKKPSLLHTLFVFQPPFHLQRKSWGSGQRPNFFDEEGRMIGNGAGMQAHTTSQDSDQSAEQMRIPVAIVGRGGRRPSGNQELSMAPRVFHVTPSKGSTCGGFNVMVFGVNFYEGLGVFFGTTPSPGVDFVSANLLVCMVPAAFVAGEVSVAIEGYGEHNGGGGQVSFTYEWNVEQQLAQLIFLTVEKRVLAAACRSNGVPRTGEEGFPAEQSEAVAAVFRFAVNGRKEEFISSTMEDHRFEDAVINSLKTITEHTPLPGCTILVRSDPGGQNLLHLATQLGFCRLASFLVQHGVDVNQRDWSSFTSLHYAAANGHLEVVRLLVESGANGGLLDLNELRPIDLADYRGHDDVVRFLDQCVEDPFLSSEQGETNTQGLRTSIEVDSVTDDERTVNSDSLISSESVLSPRSSPLAHSFVLPPSISQRQLSPSFAEDLEETDVEVCEITSNCCSCSVVTDSEVEIEKDAA